MTVTASSSSLRPVYKKLVQLAKSLPEPKRQTTLDQIRSEFRSHSNITDPKEIAALLQRAQSQIGYLKIITPRSESNTGVKKYVYKNGQRLEENAYEENARYKTVDMEANLKRHHQLLRRQYFLDRKSGPPRPIFS